MNDSWWMNDPLMSPLLLGTAHELSSSSALWPKYQFYTQASSYLKYPCNTWHIHGPKRICNSEFECNNYKFRMKIIVSGAQISKIITSNTCQYSRDRPFVGKGFWRSTQKSSVIVHPHFRRKRTKTQTQRQNGEQHFTEWSMNWLWLLAEGSLNRQTKSIYLDGYRYR